MKDNSKVSKNDNFSYLDILIALGKMGGIRRSVTCTTAEIGDILGISQQTASRKLVEQYQKTNVLVLPSLLESFGMVLLEAMACGKPVIGTNVGGIPFVIDDNETGLLVPPKDPEAIAKAIIKIFKDPELVKRMGENGYKKVKENFLWENQVKKTKEVFIKQI